MWNASVSLTSVRRRAYRWSTARLSSEPGCLKSENVRGKARQGEARVRRLSRVRIESRNKTVPESLQKRLLAGTASGGRWQTGSNSGRKDATKNKRSPRARRVGGWLVLEQSHTASPEEGF